MTRIRKKTPSKPVTTEYLEEIIANQVEYIKELEEKLFDLAVELGSMKGKNIFHGN